MKSAVCIRTGKTISRMIIFASVMILFAAVGVKSFAAPGEKTATTQEIQAVFQAQRIAGGLETGLDKSTFKNSEKKLSTNLRRLADTEGEISNAEKSQIKTALKQQQSFLTANEAVENSLKKTASDLVYVYIYFQPGASSRVIDAYANTVKNRDEDAGIAAAWVPVDKLQLIASLEPVQAVQTVDAPVIRSGSTLSEGDALLKADQFRNLNQLDGGGIKIGVISSGVDHLADAVLSQDLPEGVTVLSNIIGGDEGTAMLEIVHDLAPGSSLYFHDCGDNILAFDQAVDDLANAGCQIICDDVGWIAEPYFEEGTIGAHVKALLASRNIIYLSAAGNNAQSHYQAAYRDFSTGTGHFHDASSAAGWQGIEVEIPPGGYSNLVLQWNDRFGASANDYDAVLWVYNAAAGEYQMADYSDYTQNGSGYPIEHLYYENNTSGYQYAIVDIQKFSGVAKTLELYDFGNGSFMDLNTSADSIFGQAAVTNVIAVGAINAEDPGIIAEYSSQGPVTISYPTVQSRKKPDLCAVDGVSISGAGDFGTSFYGTSAAVPHAAAVAALIWAQNPDKTAEQIRTMLLGGTVDMGTSGFDDVYGYGLLDTLLAGAPAKPQGLSLVCDELKATLKWTANSEADLSGYQIEYKTAAAAAWTIVPAVKTAVSAVIPSVSAGGQYQFRIKAKDAALNWSAYSDLLSVTAADTTPPPVPAGLSVVSVNQGQAALAWSPLTAADLLGYRLKYNKTGEMEFTEIDLGKVAGYTASSLTDDQEYAFQIRSRDLAGNLSEYSAPVPGTPTDKTAPGVPTGLAAVLGSDCSARLTWNRNPEGDAAQYEVAYQKSGAASWVSELVTSPVTSLTLALDSSSQYAFRIRVSDLKGNWSAYSLPVNLTTPAVTMTAVLESSCREGAESGKTITITLNNGKFAAAESFIPAMVQITGLPAGVVKGEITRSSDHVLQVVLDGNSTSDYDLNVSAVVTVAKEGILPLQSAALFKTVVFTPLAEGAPAAPAVSFSFIGDNGGRLIGMMANTFEYSLDGGIIYQTAAENDQKLSGLELASVNGTKDIRVRVKATLRVPAGLVKIIDILPPSAAPAVTFSFSGASAGKLVGGTTAMEYSVDGGASYVSLVASGEVLSRDVLASISAANDIRIRTKLTANKLVGADKLIAIAPGPAAPVITRNDTLNTVTGLTALMEYKFNDDQYWSKFIAASPPDLSGDLVLRARIAAASLKAPGEPASLTYTENLPLVAELSLISPITEAAESGKTITIDLTYGEFISPLNAANITLAGLPAGVSKGTVTRVSSTRMTIALSGNSTVDYDEDRNVAVTVKKGQILPVQSGDTVLDTELTAVNEPVPAAPTGISFSFDGLNSGKLMGATTLMEYSINGGRSYLPVGALNTVLSSAQIAAINDADDLWIRLKKTLRNPAGEDRVIDIQIGPDLPDAILGDDAANTISGVVMGMEFSIDGGSTWTKYSGTNLPPLSGNVNLWLRLSAAGTTEAGRAAAFAFTATNPALSITAAHNGITEGAESGKIITVTLTNGSFVTTLATAEIQLTGLPAGVSKGAVTRKSAGMLTIALSGNSTADYGSNQTITVSIGKGQVSPAQPANLTTEMAMAGSDAAAPAAPGGISFSFDGSNAGKLIGSTTLMEYSVDGGLVYYPVTAVNGLIAAATLAGISAGDDIRVRLKKTAKAPAGEALVIDIQAGAALPENVLGDDAANTISGMAVGMEFSVNAGTSWTKYSGTNLPLLSGTVNLNVRRSGFNLSAPGPAAAFAFTATNPALSITAAHNGITEGAESGKIITVTLTNGSFVTTLATAEIQLTGLPAGVSKGAVTRKSAGMLTIALSGNSTADYGSDQTITVSIGKGQVSPAQPANLTTEMAMAGSDAAAPAAPGGISFSFDGSNAGKLIGSTTLMEYSVDGGLVYYPVTAVNGLIAAATLAGISAGDDIRVRLKKTAKAPAGEALVIDIQAGAALPENVLGDDAANTMSGLAVGMEFSVNAGASWTKYSGTNLPLLSGTVNLSVRRSSVNLSAPGSAAAFAFTATNPALSISAVHNGITEGAESGKIITVTLTNGSFITTLATAEIQLTGLPAGVSRGTVTRKSAGMLTIALSGNSTADYGSDQTITVSIGKGQVSPAQPANLTTELAMAGSDAAAPAAPVGISFSFDGSSAGKLIGSTTLMEYSVDGGLAYNAITAANGPVNPALIAAIDPVNDIRVRLKKSAKAPAGEDLIIDIQSGPALANTVIASDAANRMIGMTALMEFSPDDGLTWTKYSGGNLPDLTGDLALQVRLVTTAAGIMTAAGEARTFIFTATNPELSLEIEADISEGTEDGEIIKVTLINGQFATLPSEPEIELTGLPAGVSVGTILRQSNRELSITLLGNRSEDYDEDKEIEVSIGKDLVSPAQPANLTASFTISCIIEPTPDAPADLQVVYKGTEQAEVSWTAVAADDLAGYQLEYKTMAASTWTEIPLAKTELSYTVAGMVNDAWYKFRIKAENEAGSWSHYAPYYESGYHYYFTYVHLPDSLPAITAVIDNYVVDGDPWVDTDVHGVTMSYEVASASSVFIENAIYEYIISNNKIKAGQLKFAPDYFRDNAVLSSETGDCGNFDADEPDQNRYAVVTNTDPHDYGVEINGVWHHADEATIIYDYRDYYDGDDDPIFDEYNAFHRIYTGDEIICIDNGDGDHTAAMFIVVSNIDI